MAPSHNQSAALPRPLIHTRTRLAKFIEAGDTDEVVLVPNASHGINTILKNFDWHEGDIIIEGM